MATVKCRTTNYFLISFVDVVGSRIQDLRPGRARDHEWIKIRIWDPNKHSGSATQKDWVLCLFFIFCLNFSHVILDEVHERDVMTDIIMVLLKNVLAKRSDIKV